ncbi:serine aminopeptidase domain-containing protein [Spiroplasma endosymbiont of Panorpa germanica]|uniref:serine aminopeptidase domain-containing protein n=1 Tax=Spiroplasma endosymbiont of Panorpa germanica TaxID=3066314 RepID=UPI0030CAAD9A
MTFIQVITIFLFAALGFLLFIIILGLVIKLFIFNSLKYRYQKNHAPELIKKKWFINIDNFKLNWFGEINPKGDKIILCIHDLGFSSRQFDNIEEYMLKKNPATSVVSFDLRGHGKNEIEKYHNLGKHLFDVKQVVTYLINKYPDQKLIILGTGLGSLLTQEVMGLVNVEKVILASLSNKIFYQSLSKANSRIFWGTIFNSQKLIPLNYEPLDLMENNVGMQNYKKSLADSGFISVREFYQFNTLQRRFWKALSKNSDKVEVIQGDSDRLVNPKKIAKKIANFSNLNFKIMKNVRHFPLNDIEVEKILKDI